MELAFIPIIIVGFLFTFMWTEETCNRPYQLTEWDYFSMLYRQNHDTKLDIVANGMDKAGYEAYLVQLDEYLWGE